MLSSFFTVKGVGEMLEMKGRRKGGGRLPVYFLRRQFPGIRVDGGTQFAHRVAAASWLLTAQPHRPSSPSAQQRWGKEPSSIHSAPVCFSGWFCLQL